VYFSIEKILTKSLYYDIRYLLDLYDAKKGKRKMQWALTQKLLKFPNLCFSLDTN